ncbi:hypothetical protein NDN08_005703 [Rhodosorus marinus]|uniref:NIF system FeS cluster assembly NifU C-terminal domain-containing protein n=1 Tax=Rhodosorus marinus TaxID=101924 RepID=A0AAV8V2D6_9RHOD|nr:hypothetical protein NDN08_005703 [Rhodosorus marinus]
MAFVNGGGVVQAANGRGAVQRCGRDRNFSRSSHVRVFARASPAAAAAAETTTSDVMELTLDNVETVLDELRPYLMADGGNCSVHEIDGATVKLLLEGACGSCASSAVTMSMGIEKRLKEKIPEIESVVQVAPDGPELNEENIERVLGEVRPFLNVAGGTIELTSVTGVDGPMPTVRLQMSGTGSAINSVKMEITQRLRRNFPVIGQVMIK